jgi:enoyl-CoA hydratase
MENLETITVQKENGIAVIKFNRPEVRNAINKKMIREMMLTLQQIQEDKGIRAVILTGEGKAFQAGADLTELEAMTPLDLLRWNEGVIRVAALLENLRQPVVAAINGPAMGGGMELALACTLRVMARSARMGLPEVRLGIIPGAGGTQRLPRLIGKTKAAELILTGDPITAEEAYRLGLVNLVVPDEEVMEASFRLAKRIMRNAPIAVEMAKDAIERGKDLPLEHALEYAQKNCALCFSTHDAKEGIEAFLQKREPCFVGR